MYKILTLLFSTFLFSSCFGNNNTDSVVFLVPKNFEGVVLIVFDASSSSKPTFENGNKTYHIPENGILRTNDKPVKGVHQQLFFEVDSEGKRVLLNYYTYVDLQNKKPKLDELICYGREWGVTKNENTKQDILFEVFLVSKVKNLEKIASQKDKLVRKEIHGWE